MIRRAITALLPLCAALPLALPAPAPAPVPGPGNVVLTMKRLLTAMDTGDAAAVQELLAVPNTIGYAMRLDGEQMFEEMRKTPVGAWFELDEAGRPLSFETPEAFAAAMTSPPPGSTWRHEVRQGIAHCASQDASMGILEFDRIVEHNGEEAARKRMRVTAVMHWVDGGFRIHSWHASALAGELPIPPLPEKASKGE